MTLKTAAKPLPDTYFKLVRQFPLTPIRDDDHLDEASAVIDRLLQRDLDEGEQAYLDVLTSLVESYEAEHGRDPRRLRGGRVARVDRTAKLSQGKLAKEVGISQSTISAILGGTRSLTKGQLVKLAAYFGVPPAIFLPAEAR